MANTLIIKNKIDGSEPASGVAAGELAIKQVAASATGSSAAAATGKIYYGEDVGDGSTPDGTVVIRDFGIGIKSDNSDTQVGVPIGGNLYIKGGTGISTAGSVSGDVATVTITASGLDNYSSWTLAGDSGSSQTISSGNTASILGTAPISTAASSTDTVTISLDNDGVTDTHLAYNTGQHLTTTSAPTFATVDTGQGANELYDMNQNVQTSDAVTFATVNTGQGANELYDMNQNVQTSDAVTFATVNTGQGANELYDMDQNVLTTSSVEFDALTMQSSASSDTPLLYLNNTSDVDSYSGTIQFDKSNADGNGSHIMDIRWTAEDSADNDTTYGDISGWSRATTSGSETGRFALTLLNGSGSTGTFAIFAYGDTSAGDSHWIHLGAHAQEADNKIFLEGTTYCTQDVWIGVPDDLHGYRVTGTSNKELRFYEGDNYVGFEAPALSGNQIWVLPTADGSSGQHLTTNSSGTLSWASSTGDANVDTDLSLGTVNGSGFAINSSTGNNVSLSIATTNAWGLMSDEMFDKLDGIETSATADQTAGQILTLLEDGIDSVHYKDDSIDADHLANSINTDIATGVTASTTAGNALPKAGGAMTGAITTNSTFDGVDVAAASVLASAALPKGGGAMTGAITTNSTFDGVDVAAASVLASAALPKGGGAMTGAITTNSTFDGKTVSGLATTAEAHAYVEANALTLTAALSTNSAITGTTIDASTDFTIGSTVITDDSIVMTPSTSDTVTIAAATHGILNITTVDAAGTDANINVVADGDIFLTAKDDHIKFKDGGDRNIFVFNVGDPSLQIIDDADNPNDYFKIQLGAAGATTISTVDDDGSDANLDFNIDGTFSIASDNFDVSTGGIITQGGYTGTSISTSYTDANNYSHPNHSGDIVSSGDGSTTIQTDAVDINMLSASGTASSTTFLRGDNSWVTPTDTTTNTQNEYATSWVDSSANVLLRLTESGAGSGTQDIKMVAGSGISLTPSGTDMTIAATGGGGGDEWGDDVDSHIKPASGNSGSYDLGDADQQFRNAHFDGTVETDALTIGGVSVEAGADVTDATNVNSAGATMNSDLTSTTHVYALNQSVVSGATPTFTTTNFTDASNKRLMTDAQETILDNTSGTNTGDNTVCTSGAATTATQLYINNDESGDTSCYVLFTQDSSAGNKAVYEDSSLVYDNSNNTLTTTTFVGALTGNASGTAATVTGGTQASITTCSNLVTVGTIGSGVWQGTPITASYLNAAQTSITSLGTLTTLTVDDITINGSTISDGGDFTIDVAGDIEINADGGQVHIKDSTKAQFTFDCDTTTFKIWDESPSGAHSDYGYLKTVTTASPTNILQFEMGIVDASGSVETKPTCTLNDILITCPENLKLNAGNGEIQFYEDGTEMVAIANPATNVHIIAMGGTAANVANAVGIRYNAGEMEYRNTDHSSSSWTTFDSLSGGGGGGTPTDITVADESSDTTCFPLFVTDTTGDLGPKTGDDFKFQSATGKLELSNATAELKVSGARSFITIGNSSSNIGTAYRIYESATTTLRTGSDTDQTVVTAISFEQDPFTGHLIDVSATTVSMNHAGGIYYGST